MHQPINLYLLTGCLGAGKTTMLLSLLNGGGVGGKKIGVIQNEFGKLSIDGALLQRGDIQMQEMDGISLARELNQKLPQCAVIFLTAFLSLATEVYEAKHVYFIVKSQLEARIERAVELALNQAEEDPLLLYRCGTVQRAVASREVLYLERVPRRTRVKAAQVGDWVREAPETLLQGRPQALFVRCHQSYWVNLRHITAMERAVFVLSEGTQIPISRTFRDQARVQVYRFWTPELRENF